MHFFASPINAIMQMEHVHAMPLCLLELLFWGEGVARKEGRKEDSKEEKEASRKEVQKGREKLLRVQTQACIIQPLRMRRTCTA